MLNCDDLLTKEHMAEWSDITLSLYKDFCEKYLFKRTFKYYLENDMILNIQFKEWAMYHLWSIHHISGKFKKETLFQEIDDGFDFGDLKKTNL